MLRPRIAGKLEFFFKIPTARTCTHVRAHVRTCAQLRICAYCNLTHITQIRAAARMFAHPCVMCVQVRACTGINLKLWKYACARSCVHVRAAVRTHISDVRVRVHSCVYMRAAARSCAHIMHMQKQYYSARAHMHASPHMKYHIKTKY